VQRSAQPGLVLFTAFSGANRHPYYLDRLESMGDRTGRALHCCLRESARPKDLPPRSGWHRDAETLTIICRGSALRRCFSTCPSKGRRASNGRPAFDSARNRPRSWAELQAGGSAEVHLDLREYVATMAS